MQWYKHETDLHGRRFMVDAIAEHGLQAYAFYTILNELYGVDYNETNSAGELEISMANLRYKTHLSSKKIDKFLEYFSAHEKIIFRRDQNTIYFKLPNFIELASNWTVRNAREKKAIPPEAPPEAPPAKEEESEEEENIESEDIDIMMSAKTVLNYMGIVLNREYRDASAIIERLLEGASEEDFVRIVDAKKDDKFFQEHPYLYHPKHLFKKENFDVYLNEREWEKEGWEVQL
ncbi:MAG: conserved phage C-terminal domain-containing protein [Candidatus Latescibacteria bacterium]|nr:conserved phage C-terminal domain-containing protein [Candidatus Latescibacterota bacterium]